MSKRSASSVPLLVGGALFRKRVDSPASQSGSSFDPSVELNGDLLAPLPLTYAYIAPPLVGPASTVVEDDLVEWQSKYSLSPHIALLALASEDRASIHAPGEIPVYDAFFETGLRGVVPALIVGLCDFFEISPSQLNPPAWRILIAIQNLGDLLYLSFGINEVLFSYHMAPLKGGEGRLYLHPRSGMPIVEELPKADQKEPAFNKKWIERYAFMSLPGSTYQWNFIAGTHPAPSEGESTVLWARQLPLDRRQVDFLISETVLRRNSLWRNMSGSGADDSFAAYQEAAKVMSAKKGSASRATSRDDVTVIGSQRAIMVKTEPTSSSQRRKTRGGGVVTRASHRSADADCSAGTLATALANLNMSVFPRDGTVLLIGETSEVIQVLQGGLLRELEVRHLKEKLKASEKIANEASADALAASQENQKLAKDIETAAEDFELEMAMAVNEARVVARWELMREWINTQSDQWDLARALDQYKTVVLEDEPAVPSSRARLVMR
ncbi:hypothetical protein Bca4012_026486 [Brassica carinata]